MATFKESGKTLMIQSDFFEVFLIKIFYSVNVFVVSASLLRFFEHNVISQQLNSINLIATTIISIIFFILIFSKKQFIFDEKNRLLQVYSFFLLHEKCKQYSFNEINGLNIKNVIKLVRTGGTGKALDLRCKDGKIYILMKDPKAADVYYVGEKLSKMLNIPLREEGKVIS